MFLVLLPSSVWFCIKKTAEILDALASCDRGYGALWTGGESNIIGLLTFTWSNPLASAPGWLTASDCHQATERIYSIVKMNPTGYPDLIANAYPSVYWPSGASLTVRRRVSHSQVLFAWSSCAGSLIYTVTANVFNFGISRYRHTWRGNVCR
jgi:hypothetical protein